MYALTYTKPGHAKPSKTMLRMDPQQQELYRLVSDWVVRDLGNACRKQEIWARKKTANNQQYGLLAIFVFPICSRIVSNESGTAKYAFLWLIDKHPLILGPSDDGII